MTKKNLLYMALGSIALFLLPSCADYGYYGYSGGYGPASYGSSLAVLPYGYTRVYVGSTPYWYHGNRWYRYSGGRYIHCARPHGYNGHTYRRQYNTYPQIRRQPSSYSRPYYGHSSYSRSSSPSSYRSNTYSNRSRSPYVQRSGSASRSHGNHANRNWSSQNSRHLMRTQHRPQSNTHSSGRILRSPEALGPRHSGNRRSASGATSVTRTPVSGPPAGSRGNSPNKKEIMRKALKRFH